MSERIRSVSVEFDYPVRMKNAEVSSIEMRKPKVKDMQKAAAYSDNASHQEVWLVSALSNVPMSDIEELDIDQYELVQEAMGKFKRSPTKLVEKA